MKVYELLALLAKYPAGHDVRIKLNTEANEIIEGDVFKVEASADNEENVLVVAYRNLLE